jgi:RimJ/RimL family protein N-acetyltransferase
MTLEKENYPKVMDLVNSSNNFYPLIISVINKDIDGAIFVNEKITTAFIMNCLNWNYLIGDIANNNIFANDVIEILKTNNNKEYIWWGLNEEWEKIISNNFQVTINDFSRYKWRFNENVFSMLPKTETNYEIKTITGDNVDEIFIQENNPIKKCWNKPETFLEKGLGFFIKDNNKVISLIYSGGVYENEVEIDIVTDRNYRNKGLGKILSKKFIMECLSRNLVPKWDCYKLNQSSIGLAKSLGFEIIGEYQVKQIIFR